MFISDYAEPEAFTAEYQEWIEVMNEMNSFDEDMAQMVQGDFESWVAHMEEDFGA